MIGGERVAFFLYGLTNGGVPRRTVTLANALAGRGYEVDLVLLDPAGELRRQVAPAIRIVDVGGWRVRLPWVGRKRRRQFRVARSALARYLATARPATLIAADNYANLAAIAARDMAGVPMRLIISQRTHTSRYAVGKPRLVRRIRERYPAADAIVAVSEGVAADLLALGLPPGLVETVHNPVVGPEFAAALRRPVAHRWFRPGEWPVVLGVGRLGPQKDFATLIRAFARLRANGRQLRLVILGEGKTPRVRAELLDLAAGLGVGDSIDLPGAVPEAIPYIARARLFVLSSAWEGLPGALVEALACGTPVVSTDCPSGPSEVLDGGRVGPLVPVGDDAALAAAMAAVLDDPPSPQRLKARAELFTVDRAVERYLSLMRPAGTPGRVAESLSA